MNVSNFISYVLGKNGAKYQAIICIEECSELIKELTKFIRGKDFDRDRVAEEIADVELTLREIKDAFGISEAEVINRMQKKVDRYLQEEMEGAK